MKSEKKHIDNIFTLDKDTARRLITLANDTFDNMTKVTKALNFMEIEQEKVYYMLMVGYNIGRGIEREHILGKHLYEN